MNKFKLVIFGDEWDVYQVAHKDWIEDPKITYIPTFRPKGVPGFLQRVQFNPRLNNMLSMPGKNLWNRYYLRHTDGQRVCFLITEHWLRMENGIKLLPFLRQHYPEGKIVCFTQDLIHTIKDHYSHKPIDVDYIKNYADALISYDKTDATKYGIFYHPTVFSPIQTEDGKQQEQYDLYFLGRDKGRLNTLVKIHDEASKRGLKCRFVLLEVPKAMQAQRDGIVYQPSTVSYAENLQGCAGCKCIIEMLQADACSPTFRTWETIMLNKKLLTNNASITKSELYDPRYISVFHDETDIDWDFIIAGPAFPDGENPHQKAIVPDALISFIENILKIQIDRT